MAHLSALRWLAKCGVGAAALLLLCGLATAWVGAAMQLPATTTRDGTLLNLNRYMSEPIPDIVLVGSSLTFRLKEEYFATPRLRNLALAGGSPVTGLQIVASQQRLPKLVLVETNVLDRPVDAPLVERYSHGPAQPLFFRPIRVALALLENRMHAPLTPEQAAAERKRLLDRPPDDFDNHIYIERALDEQAGDPSKGVRDSVAKLRDLIAALEQRGTRVLLFKLPYPEAVEAARAVRITKEIVEAAFPDRARWLKFEYTREGLRWADGVHLDERSSVVTAQAIERAFVSQLRSP